MGVYWLGGCVFHDLKISEPRVRQILRVRNTAYFSTIRKEQAMPLDYNTVFSDYLSVTYHPDNNVSDAFHHHVIPMGYSEYQKSRDRYLYSFDDDPSKGTYFIEANDRYHKIELSGLALAHLREQSLLDNTLALLADKPHSVTRLDLTMDIIEPFNRSVRRFKRKYPKDLCEHGKSRLRMEYFLSRVGKDLRGAIYFGSKKGRHDVTGIVYNKSIQANEVYGFDLPKHTTRYELRFKKRVGASLRDVTSPESLFYKHASMFGMKTPKGTPEWVSGACLPEFPKITPRTPYERLDDYLQSNQAFAQMLVLADEMGTEGRTILLSKLKDKIL